jgi:hypothetical protein
MEPAIEKLLNTLMGANPTLLTYANGRIEELDGLISVIRATSQRAQIEWKI